VGKDGTLLSPFCLVGFKRHLGEWRGWGEAGEVGEMAFGKEEEESGDVNQDC